MSFVGRMVVYALIAVLVLQRSPPGSCTCDWPACRSRPCPDSGLERSGTSTICRCCIRLPSSVAVLVARVTSDVDQISRFMQWAGLMMIVNAGQALLAIIVMFVYSVPLALTVVASIPIIVLTISWFQTRLETAYLIVREKLGADVGHPGRGGRRCPGDQGVRDRGPHQGQAWKGDRGASSLSREGGRFVRRILWCERVPVVGRHRRGDDRRNHLSSAGATLRSEPSSPSCSWSSCSSSRFRSSVKQ